MKIFNKTSPVADKTVILAVREGLVQPFDAGQWLDLRIGMFLSICSATDGTGVSLAELTSVPGKPATATRDPPRVMTKTFLFGLLGGVVWAASYQRPQEILETQSEATCGPSGALPSGLAGAAMSFSSLAVVLNSLRLRKSC